MANFQTMIGIQFGRLTVEAEAGRSARGAVLWACRCTCGAEKVAAGVALRAGQTKSCGCLRRDVDAGLERKVRMCRSCGDPYEARVTGRQSYRCVPCERSRIAGEQR
jgi:hypothetical protein